MKLVNPINVPIPMLEEFKKSFNGEHIHGADNINTLSIKEWLEQAELHKNFDTLPVGRVPAMQYLLLDEANKKIVGCIQLRLSLNDFLEKYAGHVGYSVRPDERRKGYAKLMLNEIITIASNFNIPKIMVTCLIENIGSNGTIKSCGGIFHSTIDKKEDGKTVFLNRYWIDTKKSA